MISKTKTSHTCSLWFYQLLRILIGSSRCLLLLCLVAVISLVMIFYAHLKTRSIVEVIWQIKSGCIKAREDEGREHTPKPITVFLKSICSFTPHCESSFRYVSIVTQPVTTGLYRRSGVFLKNSHVLLKTSSFNQIETNRHHQHWKRPMFEKWIILSHLLLLEIKREGCQLRKTFLICAFHQSKQLDGSSHPWFNFS